MNTLGRVSRAVLRASSACQTRALISAPARTPAVMGAVRTGAQMAAPAFVPLGNLARRNLHIPVTGKDTKRTNDALRHTLHKEISHEEETYTGSPEDIDEYLKTTGWELEDYDGNREVYLRKTLGNEEINITFGVMDPEQQMEPAEVDEDGAVAEEPVVIPFTVCVTKTENGKDCGTLTAEMVACAGRCDVTQVTFSPSTEEAMGESADDYEERLANYPGPSLHDLDSDVKDAMAEFFSSRGVDDNLAAFIERVYYDKEQREYMQWLRSLHSFLEK